jgi:hypothetical protein
VLDLYQKRKERENVDPKIKGAKNKNKNRQLYLTKDYK